MASAMSSTASKALSSAASSSSKSSFWSNLARIPAEHPFKFGVGVSCAKTSFSDLLVQKVVEQREEVDWKRNAAFATFGFFYLGGVQYAIYVPIFGRIFPNAASFAAKPLREKVKDVKGIRSLLGQVFLDQFVHHPLMYFPAFYCTKELVMSENPNLRRTLEEYRSNMKEDLVALWKVWLPTTMANFALMPMWARIPWVAGTSLVWTCILSAMRGGAVQDGDAMAGGAVSSATMKIMNEGLRDIRTSPVELDPNMAHICVSASGPDKVGWVSSVARVVAENGGNVTHSKMIRLGHEFTILMHVAVKPEQHRLLIKAIRQNESLAPLNPRVSSLTKRQTQKTKEALTGVRLHCVGADKPGMLAAVAESLSGRGLSVEDISTELRMGKGGRREFVINAECTTHHKLDKEHVDMLVSELSVVKEEIELDILDIRVHTE